MRFIKNMKISCINNEVNERECTRKRNNQNERKSVGSLETKRAGDTIRDKRLILRRHLIVTSGDISETPLASYELR